MPLPMTTREGFSQGSLPTEPNRVPEQLSEVEKAREREEGYAVGGFVESRQQYQGYQSGISGYSPIYGQTGEPYYRPTLG
jgi:hypothetical protein